MSGFIGRAEEVPDKLNETTTLDTSGATPLDI